MNSQINYVVAEAETSTTVASIEWEETTVRRSPRRGLAPKHWMYLCCFAIAFTATISTTLMHAAGNSLNRFRVFVDLKKVERIRAPALSRDDGAVEKLFEASESEKGAIASESAELKELHTKLLDFVVTGSSGSFSSYLNAVKDLAKSNQLDKKTISMSIEEPLDLFEQRIFLEVKRENWGRVREYTLQIASILDAFDTSPNFAVEYRDLTARQNRVLILRALFEDVLFPYQEPQAFKEILEKISANRKMRLDDQHRTARYEMWERFFQAKEEIRLRAYKSAEANFLTSGAAPTAMTFLSDLSFLGAARSIYWASRETRDLKSLVHSRTRLTSLRASIVSKNLQNDVLYYEESLGLSK